MIFKGLEYRPYKSRINWIDIARCISIAIIVYAHTYDEAIISDFVHVFHVPVFFVLSGLVWKKAKDMKAFLYSMLKNLLIPYLIAGAFSIVAYQIMGSMFSGNKLGWIDCIKGLLYANSRTGLMNWNRPLWFIPCLVTTRFMWELIAKVKKEYVQYLVVAGLVALGAIVVKTDLASIKLPWEAEVAVHALLYFSMGVLISRHTPIRSNDFAEKTSLARLLPVITVSFGICMLVFNINPEPISFQYNHYGVYPLFVFGAFAGATFVGGISLYIRQSKLLETVGQNSLNVLLWHKFPILIFQATGFGKKCMKTPDTATSILIGLGVVVVSIAVSLAIAFVISKILGFFLEKKNS